MRGGGTIAEAILRFRKSPPRSRDEREKSPSKFWWQDNSGERREAGGSGSVEDFSGREEAALADVEEESLAHSAWSFRGALAEAADAEGSPCPDSGGAAGCSSSGESSAATGVGEEETKGADNELRGPAKEPASKQDEEEEDVGPKVGGACESSPPEGDDSQTAMQALAAQHPKLFQALHSKVGAAVAMKGNVQSPTTPDDTEAQTHSEELEADAPETVLGASLGTSEEVVDEEEILGCASDDSEEEEEEGSTCEPSAGGTGSVGGAMIEVEQQTRGIAEPTSTVESLEDVLEDALEDARSSLEVEKKDVDSTAGGEQESKTQVDPPIVETARDATQQNPSMRTDLLTSEVAGSQGIQIEEQESEETPKADEVEDVLRNSGDELIRKVLGEIEAQVGPEAFTSDLATNFELQAMIRRQIESAQEEYGASPTKSVEEMLVQAAQPEVMLSSPPVNDSVEVRGEKCAPGTQSPDSCESNKCHQAAALIQRNFRSFKKRKNLVEREKCQPPHETFEDKYKEYLAACTGEVVRIWTEVSNLMETFPSICTQLYQDTLLMNNKKAHQQLGVEEAIGVLVSALTLEEKVNTYMRAIFQLESCGETLSLEQLQSKSARNMSLREDYVPDADSKSQLQEAYRILCSGNGKHVFEQLDFDRTNKFTLPRIACGFEILFEASSQQLIELCKQVIHYLALKDLWELTYADVTRAFQMIGGIEVEASNSENQTVDKDAPYKEGGNSKGEEDRQVAMEQRLDKTVEKNLEELDRIYDQIEDDLKEDEEADDAKSDSSGSVGEIMKAIDTLPTQEIEAIESSLKQKLEDVNLARKDSDSSDDFCRTDEPATAQKAELLVSKTVCDADHTAQTGAGDVENTSNMEDRKGMQEVSSKPETRDCATQFAQPQVTAPRVGAGADGKENILEKALDRVRLAKKLSSQKKIRQNILSHIGDLSVDDLLHKLPENCVLRESLIMQRREGVEAPTPEVNDQAPCSRTTFDAGSSSTERRLDGTDADVYDRSSWRPDLATSQQSGIHCGGDHESDPGVNHSVLTKVSDRICRELDNLLSNYGRRDSPPRQSSPSYEAGSQKLLTRQDGEPQKQQGWNSKEAVWGSKNGFTPFFPFPYPYYGQGRPCYAPSPEGLFGSASEPRETAPITQPPGPLPEDIGLFSKVHAKRSGQRGGGGPFVPAEVAYSVEDSFQYISRQGWSSSDSKYPRPPSSIEAFERDDLKRAYVNTWQQVQAVYHA